MTFLSRIWLMGIFVPFFVSSAAAVDALDLLSCRSAPSGRIDLVYGDAPLDTVLADLERQRPGMNLKVRARTTREEEEVLRTPVTMELRGVAWDAGLRYLAERLHLKLDRELETSGLLFLEQVPRTSDTFNGVPLGVALSEIARRGQANVVFSPGVDTDRPIYLSFSDVPWREALDSVLRAYSLVVREDANGRIFRVATRAEAGEAMETRLRPLRFARPETAVVRPEGYWTNPLGAAREPGASGGASRPRSILAILNEIKSPNGSVGYEPRTNSLVLTDTQEKTREMLALVNAFDVPPGQVILSMRIVTIDAASPTYPEIRWDAEAVWRGEGGDGSRDAFGGIGVMTPEAVSILEAVARVDPCISIVQAPDMLVMDGEEASVFVGDLRACLTQPGQAPDVNGVLAGSWMSVVPSVCRDDDRIILDMAPCLTGGPVIDRIGPGGVPFDLPVRSGIKAARSKMLIRSSETAVIAGLLEDVETGGAGRSGASRFASRRGEEKPGTTVRRNTLILVTPTIMASPCDGETDPDVELARQAVAAAYSY